MKHLISHLRSYAAVDEALEQFLRKIIKRTTHEKGKLIVRPGDIAGRIYFIEKGLIRGYRIKDNKERTKYFMDEGEIFISIRSFLTQTPAKEYIECMEDCIFH